MTAPKSQTMQQRFGFQDSQLTTPKHDELMIWLDEWLDKYTLSIADLIRTSEVVVCDSKRNRTTHMDIEDFCIQFGFHKEEVCQEVKGLSLKKIWEYPIVSKSQTQSYTIGFADMLCKASWGLSNSYYKVHEKLFDSTGHDRELFFEVKPTIPSLGEVIRQIRMYQTYTTGLWFVVSPDARFKSQLEAQGIGFIQAE